MTLPCHSYIIFGNTLPSFYFHLLPLHNSCILLFLLLLPAHLPPLFYRFPFPLSAINQGGREKIFSSFGYIPKCNHTLFTDLPYICSSISLALFSFGEPIMFCDFFKASSLKLNDTLLLDLIYTRAKYPGFIARPECFNIRFILLITLRNMNLIQNYHR